MCEYTGVDPNDIDIIVGTLSKSFASCGGFVCAKAAVIKWFRHTLPGFVYSVGLSPVISAAALAALELAQSESWRMRAPRATTANCSSPYAHERRPRHRAGDWPGRGANPFQGQRTRRLKPRRSSTRQRLLRAADHSGRRPEEISRALRFFLSAMHTEGRYPRRDRPVLAELAGARDGKPLADGGGRDGLVRGLGAPAHDGGRRGLASRDDMLRDCEGA